MILFIMIMGENNFQHTHLLKDGVFVLATKYLRERGEGKIIFKCLEIVDENWKVIRKWCVKPPWRNGLACWTSNSKVVGSSPTGGVLFSFYCFTIESGGWINRRLIIDIISCSCTVDCPYHIFNYQERHHSQVNLKTCLYTRTRLFIIWL